MYLRVREEEGGQQRDIIIGEGQMFLLPGNTPHNPIRFADTVGLVIERRREPQHIDKLRWYCDVCGLVTFEEAFHCADINNQLKGIIERYASDAELRLCRGCGHANVAME